MRQFNNLLPIETRLRFQQKRVKQVWYRTIAIAGLLAGAVIFVGQWTIARHQAEIDAEVSAATYPRQIQRENQQLRVEMQRLVNYETRHLDMRSRYSPLAIFSLLTEIKQHLDSELYVESVDFSLTDPSPNSGGQPTAQVSTADASKSSSANQGRVILQVVTSTTSNSSQFLQLLEQSGYFEDVQLSSSLEKLNTTSADLRFTVQCRF
ncbi:PilN domain-containing protein [Aureliella helgolandensis]|uniref:Fimbrial assembly protein (PilN) n=1 Tax=Aureliella helgolandensis TaxID=2527968 RepID=A0A518GHQ4_9BACT|nr:PilN domain-containing protein [Aureliella helgolandensis]QDV28126.1 hypothetical protein Q31a_65210 [Aureliella helgolandensis]